MAEKITLGEIKEVIKAEKVSPSDLFGVEDLTTDPLVRSFLETSVKELKSKLSGEYEARKRIEKGSDKDKDETSDEMKKKDDLIKKLQIDGAKVKSGELFTTKIKERKLDDKQSKFIKSKQNDFSPEDPENTEKEVDKFMDDKLVEYKETAKIFGHKTEETKEETKGGGEPSEDGGEEEDFTPD